MEFRIWGLVVWVTWGQVVRSRALTVVYMNARPDNELKVR